MSRMDKNYIRQQISKYQAASSTKIKDDCLWRIADVANLFGKKINPDGSLSEEQKEAVIEFIRDFNEPIII